MVAVRHIEERDAAALHELEDALDRDKAGFVVEGTKRQSVFVDGAPVDEICMAKLLPAPERG